MGRSYSTGIVVPPVPMSTSWKFCGSSGPVGKKRSTDHLFIATRYLPSGWQVSPWVVHRWPMLYCTGVLVISFQGCSPLLAVYSPPRLQRATAESRNRDV